MSDEKAQVRAQMARRRKAAHARHAADASERACAQVTRLVRAHYGGSAPHVTMAGYMPIRSEIDPRAAMRAHPGPVGVPVIPALHAPLRFDRWTPDTPMTEGRFGAQVPAQSDPVTPQVLIVPLLAFDRRGFRLGYGGGFYDRTLEKLRAEGPVLAIGLAFAAQELPGVPTEPTDQPLDMVVTEQGVIRPAR
jgi:5-formyltetrahydrofolate cyclo-ligase